MKQTLGFTLSVLAAALLLASLYSGPAASGALAAAAPAKLDGKQIFLARKCNLCHTVSSAGIERTVKSEKVAQTEAVRRPLGRASPSMKRATTMHACFR